MNVDTIGMAGRYCEQALRCESSAVSAGDFLSAAAWADIAAVWSALAFEESAMGVRACG